MKKRILPLCLLSGIAASLAFSSCTYDPYYSSSGGYYGSGYSSGYGYGYGYGGSSFSTSFFVSTGDPRWGYDPYTYCYYDYHRRCYYDPYLYGYYPIGYRPPVIVGVPHPYGWRPGHGYCPPPRIVRNTTVVNYSNREAAYRNSNYSWARKVRQRSYENQDHRRDSGPRIYNTRQPDYRKDSRYTRDRDAGHNKPVFAPTYQNRTRDYRPEPRETRSYFQRGDDRSSRYPTREATQSSYQRGGNGRTWSEPARPQPPQVMPRTYRHSSDQPKINYRGQSENHPSRNPEPKKSGWLNPDGNSNRKLRSLGDG